jgi:hypothetical protein
LSIERRGSTVTLSSSRGPGASFEADGRVRNERGPDGRMVTTRAEMVGNQLRVSTTGRARNDNITLTFEPVDNGNTLRVTRRLDDNQLRAPVTLQSFYRRTTSTPAWDVYDRRGNDTTRRAGGFGRSNTAWEIPDGTHLIARLDTPLSMRDTRDGEPFTLTVDSPNEWQGARIDGTVRRVNVNSTRQGGANGDLRLDFRTIDLRGRQSDFDAALESVRLPNGTEVRADREGSVRDSNDTATTVRNGAIGAAIGAVIGAVAGGGSRDAAIGAVVGGVGGVVGGMILQQGHEQLDMPRGTDFMLTSIGRDSR